MNIVNIKISEIKPYEKNPRKNDTAVNGVAESIKKFGWQQPIVVDSQNVIVAGHTRYKAAKKLGVETVPCVCATELTPEQIKAYRILDNKLNEQSVWDFQLLSEELSDLEFDFSSFNVSLPTFNIQEYLLPTTNSDETSILEGTGETIKNSTDANTSQEHDFGPLPKELSGIDLNATHIPEIRGDNEVKLDRVIIVFEKEKAPDVAKLLNLDSIDKVIYKIEELL